MRRHAGLGPDMREMREFHEAETLPAGLERDELWLDRNPALAFCLSMIFSENRFPLFRIML